MRSSNRVKILLCYVYDEQYTGSFNQESVPALNHVEYIYGNVYRNLININVGKEIMREY